MNWKFLLILRGKNKFVIHRPGSVRIGKNCARGLKNVFSSGTVFPYPDRARPVNNIYIHIDSAPYIEMLNYHRHFGVIVEYIVEFEAVWFHMCSILWR